MYDVTHHKPHPEDCCESLKRIPGPRCTTSVTQIDDARAARAAEMPSSASPHRQIVVPDLVFQFQE
jgi:hypothetical protein